MDIRQNLKIVQNLVMTPQLQQAIKLLQLSRLELLETINQELSENPVLEEVIDPEKDTPLESDNAILNENQGKEIVIDGNIRDSEIDWSNYFDDYNSSGKFNFETEYRETPQYESFIAKKESLFDHLMWQLILSTPDETEKQIGTLIIGNLNSDGYLDASVNEIATACGQTLLLVKSILERIQTFDPVGVCARNIRECLLIQTNYLGIDNQLVFKIIDKHLNDLNTKNPKQLSKVLNEKIDDVIEALNIIRKLEPKPGRAFSEADTQYISPDIYVYRLENDFLIVLNEDGMPKLRVSAFYQDAMHRNKFNEQAKEYMQQKLKSAAWLIKSIQQRQKTIYRVTESIVKFQRDFFEKGIGYLKPMVLRDIAEDIEMHESTISRVTTNKYVFTPHGLYELKYFFSSSISRIDGEAVAATSVQEKIRLIVEKEDGVNPYSDDAISIKLRESNIKIARRTVAKYRESLGILPSTKRKQN